MDYYYEKMDEKMKMVRCPMDDKDGSICGHIVIGLQRWFDENPEERIRLGWIKHITFDRSELVYDPQTQYVTTTTRQVDEYTVEDVPHIKTKDEDQLEFEERLSIANGGGIVFY